MDEREMDPAPDEVVVPREEVERLKRRGRPIETVEEERLRLEATAAVAALQSQRPGVPRDFA